MGNSRVSGHASVSRLYRALSLSNGWSVRRTLSLTRKLAIVPYLCQRQWTHNPRYEMEINELSASVFGNNLWQTTKKNGVSDSLNVDWVLFNELEYLVQLLP